MSKTVALALGTFDGIHKGHLAVLGSAIKSKAEKRVVVTFAAPPMKVGAKLVMPESVKEKEFLKLGFDEILLLDFEKVKDMSPTEFLDMIFEKYNVKSISCGFNYRFGKRAAGDTETLKEYANSRGAECKIIDPVYYKGEPISSTRIRSAVQNGDIESANEMLGFPFFLESKVISGDARGRKMGFPTANQIPDKDVAIPKFGVYKTETELDGKKYSSITNIGIRPTYKTETPIAETHIIGFSGDIYGKTMRVGFIRFIREEKKFSCLEEVREQIEKDLAF